MRAAEPAQRLDPVGHRGEVGVERAEAGGPTTCMELTALRRPFVYVPLRHHFEQNVHVRHRLERYRAGTHLPYELAAEPDALAAAILAELDRVVDYRPVDTTGAARAAGLLAGLL
ncbi:MAG: glycosyltransferase [Phycicoccus sp.]